MDVALKDDLYDLLKEHADDMDLKEEWIDNVVLNRDQLAYIMSLIRYELLDIYRTTLANHDRPYTGKPVRRIL